MFKELDKIRPSSRSAALRLEPFGQGLRTAPSLEPPAQAQGTENHIEKFQKGQRIMDILSLEPFENGTPAWDMRLEQLRRMPLEELNALKLLREREEKAKLAIQIAEYEGFTGVEKIEERAVVLMEHSRAELRRLVEHWKELEAKHGSAVGFGNAVHALMETMYTVSKNTRLTMTGSVTLKTLMGATNPHATDYQLRGDTELDHFNELWVDAHLWALDQTGYWGENEP